MAAPAALLSQLHQQWSVKFKVEPLDSLSDLVMDALDGGTEVAAASAPARAAPLSLASLQQFLLSSDLRTLPLAPPLPEGFMQQKPPAALPGPLFLMLLSSRDITLPLKEGAEDFAAAAAAAPCYRGHKRRMLLLKLTDGAGCTYTAIEHQYCRQLDVALVPGLKMLLSPSTRLMNGLFLLQPATVQVLGGRVGSLESAFKLREQVQQARLHRKVGGGGEDEAPPRFVPFSYAAAKKALAEGQGVVAAALESQHQKSREKAQNAHRGEDREEARKTLQQLKDEVDAGGAGGAGSKVEKFQQKQHEEAKKAALQSLVVTPGTRDRGERRGRPRDEAGEGAGVRGGGRGRGRGRRRDDDDEGLYMRDPKAPVAYDLLDLICKEKPSAAARTPPASAPASAPAVNLSLQSVPPSAREAPPQSAPSAPPQRRGGLPSEADFERGKGRRDPRGRGGRGREAPVAAHREPEGGHFSSYYYFPEEPSFPPAGGAAFSAETHAPSQPPRPSAPGGGGAAPATRARNGPAGRAAHRGTFAGAQAAAASHARSPSPAPSPAGSAFSPYGPATPHAHAPPSHAPARPASGAFGGGGPPPRGGRGGPRGARGAGRGRGGRGGAAKREF
ncbi:hypothetical protein BESB_047800 [Besnoitia besnoiti]|uniref:RecQ-mediated genome instability protein 1 n=1 Tax=Besnoitia besnoiti TaxID=94643 RepID=A0A2A9MDK6_BESBE|nr:hypothetical protein BESB_047800 [Besnoitia besnoiti]PFH36588.1 hypothetical protein BESB_047800 [Besnoitia besnoiti]